MAMEFEHHTWAEIDLDALKQNYHSIARQAGMPLCCVIKANAYGHGDLPVARALEREGCRFFAVSCLAEAAHLRRGGLTAPRLLILGHTQPAYAKALAQSNAEQACFSLAYAQALSDQALQSGCQVAVHLKLDTGMGRIGFALRTDFEAALAEIKACFALPGLRVTGVFQHFSVCDESGAASQSYTQEQYALFQAALAALERQGYDCGVVHCDNSAGIALHPDWPGPGSARMARPGIVLYGCQPSGEVGLPGLRPVMALKALVSQVKTLQPGQSVSYGRRFTAQRPTRVATLCVGYADGYPRALSCGRGVMTLHGQPAPVVGNVCMDQTMVDVTDIPGVQPGDVATAWGGPLGDSAESIAAKTGTISYEILCGVALRVPRVYYENGQPAAVLDLFNP